MIYPDLFLFLKIVSKHKKIYQKILVIKIYIRKPVRGLAMSGITKHKTVDKHKSKIEAQHFN